MAFTILAAASAGAGAAMWAAPSIVDDEATTASLALGAGFISIGLPLLMSGAPPPPDAPSIRSPAMAYAGYALFGLTAVGVTTAVAGMVASQGQGDFVALDVTVRGLTAIGFAGTLTLTGIPLVAVGSQAPAPAQPKRAVPF
jgi:hypothetical protein